MSEWDFSKTEETKAYLILIAEKLYERTACHYLYHRFIGFKTYTNLPYFSHKLNDRFVF